MTRRIAILGFDGVQALDLFGPADVFASDVFLGRRLDDELQEHWPPYEVIVIGLTGRPSRRAAAWWFAPKWSLAPRCNSIH